MSDSELLACLSSCWKKHRYPTEQVAQEAVNRIHKKRNVALRVYFCNRCLSFNQKMCKIDIDSRLLICYNSVVVKIKLGGSYEKITF